MATAGKNRAKGIVVVLLRPIVSFSSAALAFQLCATPAGQVPPIILTLALVPAAVALMVLPLLVGAFSVVCLSVARASFATPERTRPRAKQREISWAKLTVAKDKRKFHASQLGRLLTLAVGVPLAWWYLSWISF